MSIFEKDILHFDCVSSTFDKLKEYNREKVLAVVSKIQTDGVGRMGRNWSSKEGGLYFSFYLEQNEIFKDIPFLTILVALAAFKTISNYIPCQIKWPNDIVFDGKKVCGILAKSFVTGDDITLMAGVGINVNNAIDPSLLYKAVSLKDILKKDSDTDEILNKFFCELKTLYTCSKEDIMEKYRENCVTLGREVSVDFLSGNKIIKGKCVNVLDDGTIDVETENGICNVNSGEVSVRGIYGYV